MTVKKTKNTQNKWEKIKAIPSNICKYFISKKFRKHSLIFIGLCVVLYIWLLIFARPIETLITFPGKEVNLKAITNHPAGIIDAEFFDIKSTSWNNIHGLYIDNNAEKTVYYFHGNGAPMDHFYTEMRYIGNLGYNVMSYDFPWYGKSEGKPTQLEVGNFSREFFGAMQEEKQFKNEDVIIWGYSIGTAVAIDFAKEVDFDKLILFSPLASRYDMSEKFFGFPIQRFFFRENSYVSKEVIKHIKNPTLIIHGNRDVVVPFEQGKQVYENSWAQEKYFIEIDDFGHSLITERYGDVLRWYLEDFLWEGKLKESSTFLDRETASKILAKFKKQARIDALDLSSDSSLTKYVDPDISYNEKWYVPENMRALSRDFIVDTKWNAKMVEEAADNFEKMSEAFYKKFEEKVVVVSSYRSYNYQAGIKARGCPDNLCAKAWHSEHQSGLTADVWSASTNATWQNSPRYMKYFNWLDENAHTYGFHNPYQNGREIDGYEIEPWHWRYLWVELATYLKEKDITFAQFYYTDK